MKGSWHIGKSLLMALLCTGVAACGTRKLNVDITAPSAAAPQRGISVVGEGEAEGKPDLARVELGVEVRDEQAEQAIEEANRRAASILSALQQAGVAKEDLQTAAFSVQFERDYRPPPAPPSPSPEVEPPGPRAEPSPVPAGFYRVTNTLRVTVRAMDRLGEILGAATAAGANEVRSIQFDIDDSEALLMQARQKAMADAQRQAEQLARLAGVALGPVVSVTASAERSPAGHRPGFAMELATASRTVPIEGGEMRVVQQVHVVYSLPDER